MIYLHCSWRIPSCLVAASLLASLSSAQDRRLSYDPIQIALPESSQFQSAVVIGATTLAVWGSTGYGSDSRVIPVAYWQLVRDAAPIGVPRTLGSVEARPVGFVSILSHNGGFLIAWNDTRQSEPGVYSVIVDTMGRQTSERLLMPGGNLAYGSLRVVSTGPVVRLLWGDTTASASIVECPITDGAPEARRAVRIGVGRPVDVTQLTDGSGATMINVAGGPPRVYDTIGREIPIGPAARAKFGNVYWVEDNGAVVSTRRDTVFVHRSIWDSVADRRVLAPADYRRGILFARLDSVGRILAWSGYATVSGGPGYDAGLRVERYVVDQSGAFGQRASVFYKSLWYISPQGHLTASPRGFSWRRECAASGYYAVDIQLSGGYAGDVHEVDVRVPIWCIADSIVGVRMYPEACPDPGTVPIHRRLTRDSSAVLLEFGRTICLSAPAAFAPANVDDGQPGLLVDNGRVVLGWIASGVDSNAVLGVWTAEDDGPLEMIGTRPVDGRRPRLHADAATYLDSISVHSGGFLLVTSARWRPTVDTLRVDSQIVAIALPTREGWRDAIALRASDSTRTLRLHHAIRDHRRDETLFLTGRAAADSVVAPQVTAVARTGGVSWSVTPESWPLAAPYSVIAADSAVFLVGHRTGTTRYHFGIPVRWFAPNHPTVPTTFFMGEDGTYFRSFGAQAIVIQQIDTLGGLLLEFAPLAPPPLAPGRFLARDPLTGRVAVIMAGRSGAWLATFDRDGTLVTSTRRISAQVDSAWSPTAVFSNDTLYVAWVDRRRGRADVFGTALSVAQLATVEESMPVGDTRSLIVRPNVLYDGRTISVTESSGGPLELVRVYDATGRLVAEVRPGGVRQSQLNLAHVPAGMYTVVSSSRRYVVCAPLVVF